MLYGTPGVGGTAVGDPVELPVHPATSASAPATSTTVTPCARFLTIPGSSRTPLGGATFRRVERRLG